MNRRRTALLLSLIVLAGAVRLWGLGAQSLWFDEGIAWHAATQPNLRDAIEADPTNPPLYFLLLFAGVRFAGDSEFALRWLSAAFGVLLVPLSYQLARRYLNSAAGLFTAVLVACSPPLWWASQEARMYALMAALAVVAALAWRELLARPSRQAWIILWSSELLLLYSHSTGPIIALWLNAATAAAWLARRSLGRPDWRAWIAGQAGIAVLWAPWLIARFILLPAANQTVVSPPEISLSLLSQVWQWMWSGSWAMAALNQEPALTALSALLFALAVLIIPWRQAGARWLILHAVLLTAGILAGVTLVGINLHGRYLVVAVPFLLAAIGGGLARLRRSVSYLALAPFLLASAIGIAVPATNAAYQHDDVRGLLRYYARELAADDTVLAWSYVDRYEFAYYWDRLGVRARRTTLPEGADVDGILPLIPASGKIALNAWFAQRGDYRQMLSCILGHGTANEPATFETFGLGSALYVAAPPTLPRLRPFSAVTRPARLTGAGELPAFTTERAACVPVHLTLTQPVTQALKVALIAKNDLGWEVARSDAVFARADQKTADQVSPGAALTAYPLLRLPYGAPDGTYTVTARLYHDADLAGYDVLDGSGAATGKDVFVGHWQTKPGADWSRVNRRADPLKEVDVSLPVDGFTLLAHDAEAGQSTAVHNGSRIPLTLVWQGSGELPNLTLSDRQAGWRVDIPPARSGPRTGIIRDWREAQIPAEAGDGTAELSLPDGTVLARYAIQSQPAEFIEPPFATAVGASLDGVGALVGYSLAGNAFDRSQPISITLVWRAGERPPDQSYTVFVQALNAEGRLIAQSDAAPAGGARPTTGWRPGEYIVDTHRVAFHADANAGPARLIVGMYDPLSGARVPFASGADAVALPADIVIR